MEHLYCRKCRFNLELVDAVIKQNQACTNCEDVYNRSTVWYLDESKCPEWLNKLIAESAWTKGKIVCENCTGRLGSFNFTNTIKCSCGQHTLPTSHVLKDRVDLLARSSRVAKIRSHKGSPFSACDSCSNTSNGDSEIANRICDGLELRKVELGNDNDVDELSKETDVGGVGIETKGAEADSNHSDAQESVLLNPRQNVEDYEYWHNQAQQGRRKKRAIRKAIRLWNDLYDAENEANRGTGDDPSVHDSRIHNASTSNNTSRNVSNHTNLLDAMDEIGGDRNAFNALEVDPDVEYIDTDISDNELEETEKRVEEEDLITLPLDFPYEVTCAVCMELYYRPHTCVPCSHIFCEPCLRELCKQSPITTLCPLCRKPINKCKLNTELSEKVEEGHKSHFEIRKRELQCMKRTGAFYPLPTKKKTPRSSAFRRINFGRLRQRQGEIEPLLFRCFVDILIRLFWLLCIYIFHNTLFKICDLLSFHYYCTYTLFFNSFLKKMVLKLVNFSLLNFVRKFLGLNFDRREVLGCFVVYAALVLIFYHDSETVVQFIYNMVILGSLYIDWR